MGSALKQANVKAQILGYSLGSLKQDAQINAIMDEDFNTPNLVTYLLDLVKDLNNKIRNNEDFTSTYDKILLVNDILGLVYQLPTLSDEDKELYEQWNSYREAKDFANADIARAKLMERNIL